MFLLITLLTRIFVAFLVIASVVPLLSLGAWVVRLFDFPRFQLAMMVLIPVAGLAGWYFVKGWSLEQTVYAVLCGGVLLWQSWHIVKYTVLWQKELPDATSTATDQDVLRIAVVNLQFDNPQKETVVEQINDLNVNILLLIEIDQAWKESLSEIESHFPYREGVVRSEGLGLMLWSKLPLSKSEVRHLVSEKRASIFATVELQNSQTINLVGVHPTPPGLEIRDDDVGKEKERYDSRIRDAELMIIAREIAKKQNENWIVVGDFNDVAWSHTTRLFKRVSGLKDPRIGRGLFNSYHAKYPVLRFPIDQIFLSPGTEIVELKRFATAGSDHFAITTSFIAQTLEPADPEPQDNDLKDASDMIEEGKEDAEENGEESSEPASE